MEKTYAFVLTAGHVEEVIEAVAEELYSQDGGRSWLKSSPKMRCRYIDRATDLVFAVSSRFKEFEGDTPGERANDGFFAKDKAG